MQLLLLSNSTAPGRRYLEHALGAIDAILGSVRDLVFVPYALADHDAYTAQVSAALGPLGITVTGTHRTDCPASALIDAESIFIGGGNTFRLTAALHALGLIPAIRQAVRDGAPYLGSSAGTHVATPSLATTNDMPIVEPPSFATLGLVPFQINPHYLDPVPSSTHQGETRELRIVQYLEENPGPVLGMREGTWLRRSEATLTLGGGDAGARLFRRDHPAVQIPAGSDLTDLLQTSRH